MTDGNGYANTPLGRSVRPQPGGYPVADFLEPISLDWSENGFVVREALRKWSVQPAEAPTDDS